MKKSDGFLAYDGRIVGFANKMGEIILLNIVFLLSCLPILTAGSAMTSLYYAVVKSVRRERGYPVREFFRSMKRTFTKGIAMTFFLILWVSALVWGITLWGTVTGEWTPQAVLYGFLLLLCVCVMLYLFPVFSRFEMRLIGIVKLSFVMSIRFFPITLAVLLGTAAVGWLLIFVLPFPCIFFVPGVWCLALSFPMEKVLHTYMPKAAPGEEEWYDEKQVMRDENQRGNGEEYEA